MIDHSNELHVVFGTGPVGLSVMDELVRSGKRVRLVNRSGKARVPAGVEVRGGDASKMTFAREACAGASVVYNALNPPYDKWPELFPALQAGVLEGAAASGAKLVAMENLYMYGPTGGRPLTEDLPYAANTKKGRVRAEMSQELMEAHRRGQVQVAIGRASDFFGPRVLASAVGEQVFGRAMEGKSAQVAGDPDQPHSYTYAPDIGKGLVILGRREEALGRAWHLPSPETTTTREFVQTVFQEVGSRRVSRRRRRSCCAPSVCSIGLCAKRSRCSMSSRSHLSWITPGSRGRSGITPRRFGRPSGGRCGGMAISGPRRDEGQRPELPC